MRFTVILTLLGGAAGVVGVPRRFVMADIGNALLLIGGFVVLLLVLRGMQRW
ncbi:hypothetical protein [Pseudonocardia sp. DLS-67]